MVSIGITSFKCSNLCCVWATLKTYTKDPSLTGEGFRTRGSGFWCSGFRDLEAQGLKV